MIKFVLATLFVALPSSIALNINCNQQNNVWTPFGTLNECLTYNVISTEPNTAVTSTRLPLYSGEYASFYIYQSESCHYLPSNIPEYFENLQVLVVAHTGLKAITKEDLKPFKKLRGLYIDYSKLTSIDHDLFRFTPNLEELSLQENTIKYVEADIFKPLRRLTSLSFDRNPCADKRAEGRDNVEELFIEIESRCHIRHDYIASEAPKEVEDEQKVEEKAESEEIDSEYTYIWSEDSDEHLQTPRFQPRNVRFGK